jgi:hypothetical protein
VSKLLRVKVVFVFHVVGSKKVVGADIDFAESYCVIVIPSCFVVIALLDVFGLFESLITVVTFIALKSSLVGVVSVGVDRVDIVGAASFVAVVSDTIDAICVVEVDFVVSCLAAFDNVDKWDDLLCIFVDLVIAVV